MTGALGEKLTRFHDGRTQRETDSTAVIKAGKDAPVGGLSFIFKQADHVAYWHFSEALQCALYDRYRGAGDKRTYRGRPISVAIDPNQTSISTRKRDTLRSRWVSNRTGESRNDGAKKCSEVGHWRDHMRRGRKPCQSSLFRGRDASLLVVSRPNGQKWRRTEAACGEAL